MKKAARKKNSSSDAGTTPTEQPPPPFAPYCYAHPSALKEGDRTTQELRGLIADVRQAATHLALSKPTEEHDAVRALLSRALQIVEEAAEAASLDSSKVRGMARLTFAHSTHPDILSTLQADNPSEAFLMLDGDRWPELLPPDTMRPQDRETIQAGHDQLARLDLKLKHEIEHPARKALSAADQRNLSRAAFVNAMDTLARSPRPLTTPDWARKAGYESTGGDFGTARGELQEIGFIEQLAEKEGRNAVWQMTDAGSAYWGMNRERHAREAGIT